MLISSQVVEGKGSTKGSEAREMSPNNNFPHENRPTQPRVEDMVRHQSESFGDRDKKPYRNRWQNQFGTRSFSLRQEAISWEIAEEVAAEAKNGAAQIDLRQYAAKDAANRLMQSWEVQVADVVTDDAQYESGNVLDLDSYNGGADQFTAPTSDIEILMDQAKEQVRSQIGIYPNKLVISPDAFNALKR